MRCKVLDRFKRVKAIKAVDFPRERYYANLASKRMEERLTKILAP